MSISLEFSRSFGISYHYRTVTVGTKEMIQWLKARTTLAEDPNSVPSTFAKWLPTTCDVPPVSRDQAPCLGLHKYGAHVEKLIYTHIYKILKIKLFLK